jgi:hypothetical protein
LSKFRLGTAAAEYTQREHDMIGQQQEKVRQAMARLDHESKLQCQ